LLKYEELEATYRICGYVYDLRTSIQNFMCPAPIGHYLSLSNGELSIYFVQLSCCFWFYKEGSYICRYVPDLPK